MEKVVEIFNLNKGEKEMANVEKKITVEVDQEDICNILIEYVTGDPDTLSEILSCMTNDQSLRACVFSVEYDDVTEKITFISDNH